MSLGMFAAVAAGGALGAVTRYGVARLSGPGCSAFRGRWRRWWSMSPEAR